MNRAPGAVAVNTNVATTETANWSRRFWRRLGRRGIVIVLVVVVAATAAGAWGVVRSGSPEPSAVGDLAASLATITKRTITAQQQVNGTLGFAGAASVLQPVGTAPEAVAQADEKALAAEENVVQARADLSAAYATLAADEDRVDADWQKVRADQQAVARARASVVNAGQSWAFARSAAGDAHASALAFGQTSTYTALPAIGQVLTRGEPLFSISAQPVPLLYGPVTPWRAFRPGMAAGPDVKALNQNLADLGYGAGLAASDRFSSVTRSAIGRLQRALGLPQTGELLLGSVVFQPGPVRVTAVAPKLGAGVQPGAPVLDVTSTTRQIIVKLDAAQQSAVEVGDPVVITLPNKKTTPATVTAIGTVATEPPSSGAGSESGSSSQPTVDVVITPSDSAATGSLDAAPVQVSITTASAERALVVPVTALLALSGGGYGVEVVSPGGVNRLEAVTLGLFDDAEGLVQISGAKVRAGDQVVVAST